MTNAEKQEVEVKDMHRDPITGTPGSHPVSTSVGAVGGAIAGATAGLPAGPIGAAVGGVVGAIGGGLIGKNAGEEINPTGENLYWHEAHLDEPYYNKKYNYVDYAPAYRAGYMHRIKNDDGTWGHAEAQLRSDWENDKASSRLSWENAKHAARAAWHRVHNALAGTTNKGIYY